MKDSQHVESARISMEKSNKSSGEKKFIKRGKEVTKTLKFIFLLLLTELMTYPLSLITALSVGRVEDYNFLTFLSFQLFQEAQSHKIFHVHERINSRYREH